MPTNELAFRADLLKAARSIVGVHAIGLNDRFIVGYPDVYIKHPHYTRSFWLELKFHKVARFENRIKMGSGLSGMQRVFMRTHQRAGGYAAWLLCGRIQGGGGAPSHILFAGIDPDTVYATENDIVEVKSPRGGDFSVPLLLVHVANLFAEREEKWSQ